MSYFKYVPYLYLIMAGFFVYSGIMGIVEKSTANAVISFGFAAVAVFMFFFRRKFQKKFQDRTPKN
jgi:hypothetical protein